MNQIVKKNILGVEVSDISLEEVLEYILTTVSEKGKSYYVVTPNPEMIVRSKSDGSLRHALNRAELSLCDGIGLLIASRLLRKPLKERITGTDLVDLLCKEVVRKPVSVGFLGGRGSVALKTAECLVKKYPGLDVGFVASEWGEKGFEARLSPKDIKQQKRVDILFVAFGFPKQELWMLEQVKNMDFRVAIGVGGAFDYISGEVARAPMALRSIGLEWLYRLVRQPWRWKRQLALLHFIVLVIREILTSNSSKTTS